MTGESARRYLLPKVFLASQDASISHWNTAKQTMLKYGTNCRPFFNALGEYRLTSATDRRRRMKSRRFESRNPTPQRHVSASG